MVANDVFFFKWRPPPSWIYFQCRFSSYRRFWIVALYVLAKFDKSTSFCGWVIEVCPKIQNGGCPPSWIINWLSWKFYCWPEACVQISCQSDYICEDISDRTFRKFGLKCLFAPPKFSLRFRAFWPLNISFHHRDPQKALPWRKTRAMSHRASKSVQRCGQESRTRCEEYNKTKGRTKNSDKLGIRPSHPLISICTIFCMLGGTLEMFLKFEFQNDRSRNFEAVGVEVRHLTLTRLIAYTTACCYRTSRDSRGFAGESTSNESGVVENDDSRFFRSLYLPNLHIQGHNYYIVLCSRLVALHWHRNIRWMVILCQNVFRFST